jgi:hypothetical protein
MLLFVFFSYHSKFYNTFSTIFLLFFSLNDNFLTSETPYGCTVFSQSILSKGILVKATRKPPPPFPCSQPDLSRFLFDGRGDRAKIVCTEKICK